MAPYVAARRWCLAKRTNANFCELVRKRSLVPCVERSERTNGTPRRRPFIRCVRRTGAVRKGARRSQTVLRAIALRAALAIESRVWGARGR
jgi:hypothetical protein